MLVVALPTPTAMIPPRRSFNEQVHAVAVKEEAVLNVALFAEDVEAQWLGVVFLIVPRWACDPLERAAGLWSVQLCFSGT